VLSSSLLDSLEIAFEGEVGYDSSLAIREALELPARVTKRGNFVSEIYEKPNVLMKSVQNKNLR
jgi:hypothetical protein